jgi:DNA-binding transcriptional MocR family regulator
MAQFRIQPDSEIPASTQLFNQIRFAIASRQFSPGHRLPSTRALAMQTGLHRNTISKGVPSARGKRAGRKHCWVRYLRSRSITKAATHLRFLSWNNIPKRTRLCKKV